nr:MAG TPA: hypothetical protein [Herelleviridae sp.]
MLKRCIFVSTFENASLFRFASYLVECVFVSISVVFAISSIHKGFDFMNTRFFYHMVLC